MSQEHDGGSAYPQATGTYWSGMTLRDWFAGHALAGIADNTDDDRYLAHIAKSAYALADAMLDERQKP